MAGTVSSFVDEEMIFVRLPKGKDGEQAVVSGSGRLLLLSALSLNDGIVGGKRLGEELRTEWCMQTLREPLDFEFLWCRGKYFTSKIVYPAHLVVRLR